MQLKKNKDIIEYRNNSDKEIIDGYACVPTLTKQYSPAFEMDRSLSKPGKPSIFIMPWKKKKRKRKKEKKWESKRRVKEWEIDRMR